MAYNALDIAKKILAKVNLYADREEFISNMKLQKLLYYQQGFHLALFGTPLFDEEIEAWLYGPVVPSVYQHFKKYNNKGIEYTGDTISLEEKEENLFNEVYRVYSKYSAIGLMEMTHNETPWNTTETGAGSIISKNKMKTFFKKRFK